MKRYSVILVASDIADIRPTVAAALVFDAKKAAIVIDDERLNTLRPADRSQLHDLLEYLQYHLVDGDPELKLLELSAQMQNILRISAPVEVAPELEMLPNEEIARIILARHEESDF